MMNLPKKLSVSFRRDSQDRKDLWQLVEDYFAPFYFKGIELYCGPDLIASKLPAYDPCEALEFVKELSIIDADLVRFDFLNYQVVVRICFDKHDHLVEDSIFDRIQIDFGLDFVTGYFYRRFVVSGVINDVPLMAWSDHDDEVEEDILGFFRNLKDHFVFREFSEFSKLHRRLANVPIFVNKIDEVLGIFKSLGRSFWDRALLSKFEGDVLVSSLSRLLTVDVLIRLCFLNTARVYRIRAPEWLYRSYRELYRRLEKCLVVGDVERLLK